MTRGQLREHIAGCGTCDVDLVTMTGTPCEDARELADIAGIEIASPAAQVDRALERQRQLASAGNSVGDWTDKPLGSDTYREIPGGGERLAEMMASPDQPTAEHLGVRVERSPATFTEALAMSGGAIGRMSGAYFVETGKESKPDPDFRPNPCPKGCGCALMRWWRFCPACGQAISEANK